MGNSNGFKVKAIREGYHGEGIKEVDSIFFLTNAREFSSNWMKDLTKDQNLAELAARDKAEYLASREPVKPVGVTPERKEEIEAEVKAEIKSDFIEELEADVRAKLKGELKDELEGELRDKIESEIAEAQKAAGANDKADGDEGGQGDKVLSEEEIESIKTACDMLSHDNDAHWTAKGLPDVDTVTGIVNDSDITITRKLLNELIPDLVRKQVV